jgi:hypothetical protein
METATDKTSKKKTKILKFIPKAISFRNVPFSPHGDKRIDAHKSHPHKGGFSGPIVPMIPAEARGRSRTFETQEPTSPKVSCMGQIKHRNRLSKKKQASLPREFKPVSLRRPADEAKKAGPAGPKLKRKPSGIKKFFGRGRKSDSSVDHTKPPIRDGPPSLGQMRKFASSRDAFANFDWMTAQIAPDHGDRECYSDEERRYSDGEEEEEVIIPFSAPIMASGAGLDLEPRKEINLWKRRTMARPQPLQLNTDRAN